MMQGVTFKRSGAALSALVLAGGFAVNACGGATPPAKTSSAEQKPATAAKSATDGAQPQQLGVMGGPQADTELTGAAKSAYDRGFQAWSSGDLQGAKAAFQDAASKAPSAGGPRYSLGCVLEHLGDNQGALDAYRASYGANPKYDVAVGAYATLLARTGRGADAESFLNGKRSGGESPKLTTYLAEVKSIEGDSPGCQQLAQQALEKQPDLKEAMVVIARDYYRGHRWDLARYALQAILDGSEDKSIPPRDAGNADALLLRALIERDSGQRAAALKDFEQASSRRPDLFEAYINLGEMKLEAGNATEAQGPLEKAVKYAPNVALAHLDLGDCYRLLGRPGDAKGQLDKALTMDSTLAGVHYDLGLLYLFSPSVPGASGPDDQLSRAITELQTYKSMKGAKSPKEAQGDDVDELLSTAKRKQSEIQLKKQAAAAASAAPPPPPATSAAPASSGAAAPARSAAPASSSAAPASSSRPR